MHERLLSVSEIFDLNTRLFRNCLHGFDEDQARSRLSPKNNHATFIAAHLADVRYYMAGYAGLELDNPFKQEFGGIRNIDQLENPPTLETILQHWDAVTNALRTHLDGLTAADLDAASPQKFPVADNTILGGLTFLMQHESFHVGQLAMLRKYHLGEAMGYD